MDYLKKIKFTCKGLKNIPLHFRKIYFNQVTFMDDELKMMKYNNHFQTEIMRDYYPSRQISKTIDFKYFNDDK